MQKVVLLNIYIETKILQYQEKKVDNLARERTAENEQVNKTLVPLLFLAVI